MEHLDVGPLKTARGTIKLPGSKSISNRVLLLAALAPLGGAPGVTALKNKCVSQHNIAAMCSRVVATTRGVLIAQQ